MREWIVTNGLGGYASLTNHHSNTRKFHGLFIPSLHPPGDRWVFVSNCYDLLVSDGKMHPLNPAPSTFSFSLCPILTFSNELGVVQKTFFMSYHKNTLVIRYDILPRKPFSIRHFPLITSRHFYDVYPQPHGFDVQIQEQENHLAISPNNVDVTLYLWKDTMEYISDYHWEYQQYEKDQQRNDASDDYVLNIGYFERMITDSFTYYLVFSLENAIPDPANLYEEEKQRKMRLIQKSQLPSDLAPMVLSSDQFIVKKGNWSTIIAGYHWFSDWGRDTLIALPGIALVTKRYDQARDILTCLGNTCHKGIIPNTYDDKTGEAAYNTVDAALWYIERVYQYMRYTDDVMFLQKIFPTIESIISNYKQGTLNNIHMDSDYLIAHDPGLTWMDVKMGEFYPTPRSKKAVEIQALWYHDLCIMDTFSKILGLNNEYNELSEQVRTSFCSQFHNQYDVIDALDASCRPNKLFLVSLDNTMIESALQKDIVKDVCDRLITVFGPRTVSRDHPEYKGCYMGDYPRDLTYHNGMVWPWLLGPFITAFIKSNGYSQQIRTEAYDRFLKPLFDVYGPQWDGCVHEIFDGDPVFAPRGCINQAWSVAEPLRAYVEDILLLRPAYEQKYRLHTIHV